VTLRIEVAEPSLPVLDALDVDSVAAFVGAERPLAGMASLLDWRLAGAVSRAIEAGTVTPEHGEALLLPVGGRLRASRAFLFGVDDPAPRPAALAVRRACEALRRAGARAVALSLPTGPPLADMARAWVLAAAHAGFDRLVILGDARALAVALEAAGRDAGVAVEVARLATRVPLAPTA
jgi:hypothetical protein